MADINADLNYYEYLASDAATHSTIAKLALLRNINIYYNDKCSNNNFTRNKKNRFLALACSIRNLIDMDYARDSLGRRPTQEELIDIYNEFNTVNLELRPNGIHLEVGIWLTNTEIENL